MTKSRQQTSKDAGLKPVTLSDGGFPFPDMNAIHKVLPLLFRRVTASPTDRTCTSYLAVAVSLGGVFCVQFCLVRLHNMSQYCR